MKLLESVNIPKKLPNNPRFAKDVICFSIPILLSLNHHADPC